MTLYIEAKDINNELCTLVYNDVKKINMKYNSKGLYTNVWITSYNDVIKTFALYNMEGIRINEEQNEEEL